MKPTTVFTPSLSASRAVCCISSAGGQMAGAGEHLLAGIRETVYRRSLPLATEHLRIVPSRAGRDAGVLGASAMAIEHVLSPAAVEAASEALPAS